MMPPLIRRQRAVEKVQVRFVGKAFKLGRRDCVTLAHALLCALGHQVPKLPPYTNEFGAVRALKTQGARNLAELLDGIGLKRKAPAAALPGDLIYSLGEGGAGIGALHIAQGNGAMMGFYEDQPGLVSIRWTQVEAAWDVMP